MLNVKGLRSYYGSIEALHGVDLRVRTGTITCLIGSNGAGKTSLLKAISNMIRSTGEIVFDGGKNLLELSSRRVAKMGVTHVPEGRHIFTGLSVEQNLEVGTINWHGFFSRKPFGQDMQAVYELFPRLRERREQLGWSLSGGEQQMLAVGRAMMARPRLLMLDEPSMGLAPVVVSDLFNKIQEINKQGMTILLVEQNARLALEISDYAYVIDQGNVILGGPAKELRNDPRVVEAYLGKFAAAR